MLIGFFISVLVLIALAIWGTRIQMREYQVRLERQRRLATQILAREQELDPRYQAALAAAHQREMEQAKFRLQCEQFALERYVALHRPGAETYLINEQVESMVALPSLKRPAEVVPQLAAPHQGYPQAPPFASIKSLIRPGKLILGYTVQGPIYGDITDLLSMLFAGKPGTGKSTALLYYLSMLLLTDASVYIFDHQGSLNELADFLPYFGEFKQFADPMPGIYQELREREDLWRDGKQVRKPMLVLADELPAVARYEEKNRVRYSLLDLAEEIVLEHRKHNVYCLLTGQSFPADILPTITRDNCSSRILFNSSPDHARMVGLDAESRKKMLPLLKSAPQGTAILDVTRRPEPDIVAIPYTTVEDARDALGTLGTPHGERVQVTCEDDSDAQTGAENGGNEALPANVRTFPLSSVHAPVESSDAASDERPNEYRLSTEEIAQFVPAYRASGNIDRCLAAVGKGARFRPHAREIIRALGISSLRLKRDG